MCHVCIEACGRKSWARGQRQGAAQAAAAGRLAGWPAPAPRPAPPQPTGQPCSATPCCRELSPLTDGGAKRRAKASKKANKRCKTNHKKLALTDGGGGDGGEPEGVPEVGGLRDAPREGDVVGGVGGVLRPGGGQRRDLQRWRRRRRAAARAGQESDRGRVSRAQVGWRGPCRWLYECGRRGAEVVGRRRAGGARCRRGAGAIVQEGSPSSPSRPGPP